MAKDTKEEVTKKIVAFTRPGWDEIWMETALLLSKRSYDPRHQVGTVIVTEDNTQILAVGYNGNYAGGPNEVESTVPGESGMLHSEINALLKCDYNNHKKKIAYVTLSPCKQCAKALVNAGIKEVVYKKQYRDTAGIDILKNANIVVRQII